VAGMRNFFEWVMPLVRPMTIVGFAPPPERVDENLWCLERRARMPGGIVLPTRTTIVGTIEGLLVISPPPAESGGLEAIDAIGPVREVVLANSFHHLHARGFLERHPAARLWVAPGLFRRVAGLPSGSELVAGLQTPWSGAVDHAVLEVTPEISEVALFHRASATLVLTDLAFNMVRFDSTFDRIAWRANGVPNRFGPSRTARMMLLRDRGAVKVFLERVLEWPFRRILVGHGEPVESDAIGAFRRAFGSYLA
jgi:hypothetical protein